VPTSVFSLDRLLSITESVLNAKEVKQFIYHSSSFFSR
jgi:hypothetical protein